MAHDPKRDPKRMAAGLPTPPVNPRSVKKTLPASEPPKVPRPPQRRPPADEDEYAIRPSDEYAIRSEPATAPVPLSVPRVREPVVTHDPVSAPPTWAFWSGVFSFPFYLQSLGAWMLISMGWTVGALGIVLCIWCLDVGQTIAFRCFVLPVLMIIAFTCSYASAACLAITQTTAEGYDEVDDWPKGDWREWAWTMAYPGGMFVLAALMGVGVHWLLPVTLRGGHHLGLLPELPVPVPILGLLVVFMAYPVLLLSALEAGSPTTPVSFPVLHSLAWVWWAWALLYLESGLMFAAWGTLVVLGYGRHPWLTAALGAPLLAAMAMIYARQLGRLAWCIDRYLASRPAADEDD